MVEKYHKNEDISLQVYDLFTRTARAVLRYADSCLYEKARLSPTKFIVLHVLSVSDGPMLLKDLSLFTNTAQNSITTLIERMQKDGLVITRRSEVDRRATNVELTDKGTEVATRAFGLVRDIVDRITPATNRDDMAAFMKQLSTMNQNASDALMRNSSP